MWMQGYPLELLFAGRTGDERGGSPPDHVPVLPPSITVGGHMVHAVGLAWAAKNLKDGRVALTYFGDGATSEGGFHEAMNFAGVHVPLTRKTAIEPGYLNQMLFVAGRNRVHHVVAVFFTARL